MEINKKVAFDEDDKTLINYLQKHNISFDEEYNILEMYESDPHWEYIEKYVQKARLSVLSETIFTKEELQNAEWMCVRSVWHYDYPQPFDNREYETVTYTRKHKCQECGQGLEQIDLFRMKKPPKWGKRHFMMMNWVGDELFVDEYAKTLLEKEFPYLSFCEVKNKKGTEVFSGVFQIVIPKTLNEGVVEQQRRMREVLVCPCCRKKKYHTNGEGMLQMQRKAFADALDIAKTAEWFGWGCGADRRLIINQRMYQFILSHRLERSLEFSPIELVD